MCLFIGHIWILLNQVIIIRCSWGVAKNLRKPKIKLLFSKILIFMCTIYFLLSIHILYIFIIIFMKITKQVSSKMHYCNLYFSNKEGLFKALMKSLFYLCSFWRTHFSLTLFTFFPKSTTFIVYVQKAPKAFQAIFSLKLWFTYKHTHTYGLTTVNNLWLG